MNISTIYYSGIRNHGRNKAQMIFTEEMLESYSKPLSDSEDTRCKHAIEMVRDALKELGYSDGALTTIAEGTSAYAVTLKKGLSREVTVFVQGSYANNTNVKTHSDVDIAVICESSFRAKYRAGITKENYGFIQSDLNAAQFKNEIEKALRDKFGDAVKRGNKSIKIEGNSYRTDADAAPALRYRDYSGDFRNDASAYIGGIVIVPDKGPDVINYPEQHIKLGREKNVETNHAYKKMVRIAKKIMLIMQEQGISSACGVSSFVVESLVWNVPNNVFSVHETKRHTFQALVDYLWSSSCSLSSFKEANGIKPICSDAVTEASLTAFVNDLKSFYQHE